MLLVVAPLALFADARIAAGLACCLAALALWRAAALQERERLRRARPADASTVVRQLSAWLVRRRRGPVVSEQARERGREYATGVQDGAYATLDEVIDRLAETLRLLPPAPGDSAVPVPGGRPRRAPKPVRTEPAQPPAPGEPRARRPRERPVPASRTPADPPEERPYQVRRGPVPAAPPPAAGQPEAPAAGQPERPYRLRRGPEPAAPPPAAGQSEAPAAGQPDRPYRVRRGPVPAVPPPTHPEQVHRPRRGTEPAGSPPAHSEQVHRPRRGTEPAIPTPPRPERPHQPHQPRRGPEARSTDTGAIPTRA